jgi:UDP-glucose 4-epimerase
MKKLLITGVAGFIGRNVAKYFSERGWEVYGVDRHPVQDSLLADLRGYCSCTLPGKEVSDFIERVQPFAVLHAAGRATPAISMIQLEDDYHDNASVVFYLLDQVRRVAQEARFLLLSSAAVYGQPAQLPISESEELNPLSPYGFHKWQAENICREFRDIFGMHSTALRIFSAYGPGLCRQVIYDVTSRALKSGRVELRGTGEESRDFIHVSDICRAIGLVLDTPKPDLIYNVASGVETSLRSLAELVARCLNVSAPVVFDGTRDLGMPVRWRADISRLRNIGFNAEVTFADGLAGVVDWCKKETIL